ncbi:uncharacterized protein RHOBADRAFT_43902 [Rhodotorula graminis WP1]|uniref:Cytochrome b5 heme-binding domain-containing protein n=1 Tax=Rhodotorula graminis (strain WP1) TaxID=578459 RepID=A0A194S7K8_RHOGW|nr:uncharacterized protein RHOBADRAFT_43902 [Rhodotorula graminis WP1]KPV75396.1 hypothetical protein RHOBADRAFT_43902 [Rhodotorula graminis WP1]
MSDKASLAAVTSSLSIRPLTLRPQTYTLEQVAQHASADSAWVVVEGGVYDVTSFLDDHPGGKKILLKHTGKDATEQFHKMHPRKVLEKVAVQFLIGKVGDATGSGDNTVGAIENKVKKDTPEVVEQEQEQDDADSTYFGDLVPFGDPFWYQDWKSPYYNDSHRKLRAAMRRFTDEHLTPFAAEWDQAREIPPEAYKKIADYGILAAIAAGATGWPTEYAQGIPVPGGVDAADWDGFHNLIVIDEMCRCASGGILYGVLGGFGISIGPLRHFGSDELKQRILPSLLKGEKRSCLAITEPEGGSDVANIVTTAKKSDDGQYYLVEGAKKWITNGVWCDYFVTAVRTGGKGMGGISLMVVERGEGLTTRKMDCQGVLASGTTYVTYDDVRVPVGNVLGKENKGFQIIMSSFNAERAGIAIQATRFARVCLEESIKHACRRETFGKPLIEHPVIRAKLASMAQRVEVTHAWLETVVYQSTQYDQDTLTLRGGGTMALLKAQATETFEYCVREAMQIFGGAAYTRSGVGEKIERLYRDAKAYTIPGGSFEIMQDLGIRQSVKVAQIMGAKL